MSAKDMNNTACSNASAATTRDKFLLVVSFIEGRNFPRRPKCKLVVEARFGGEQLTTDPVDHSDALEINQELAWELDKKSLQMHKLQRSCIKCVCYAIGESTPALKENIGYLVLDVRSASDGVGKSKFHNLLQSKYAKSKPSLEVNIYVEDEQNKSVTATANVDHQQQAASNISQQRIFYSTSSNESHAADAMPPSTSDESNTPATVVAPPPTPTPVPVKLVKSKGYFQIGTDGPACHTYILTITIEFARNLIKLLDVESSSMSHCGYYFAYELLGNRVQTRPFDDLVSCQINGERSSVRLHAEAAALRRFFGQQESLVVLFCSSERIIARALLDWSNAVTSSWHIRQPHDIDITNDCLLRFERFDDDADAATATIDSESPIVGVKVALGNESNNKHSDFQTVSDGLKNEPNSSETAASARRPITEEMQLQAAYELQIWKEAKEKEFEQHLKKLEAKKLQALADAFKQHDIERETIVQKKMKEYSDLELVLKNSLNEVEKREKQLALNEAHLSRLKIDLNHDYENKLLEMREASKRVQEKTDHQINLNKLKCESLEEEVAKYKRQAVEYEKRLADKEAEFARYRERESTRPDARMQAELNVLGVEKLDLEKKLAETSRAKSHYKEQWALALKEIAAIKGREEHNAKALLKKQQQELEHLRLRYLAAEENQLLKNEKKNLESLKNELDKIKLNTQQPNKSSQDNADKYHLIAAPTFAHNATNAVSSGGSSGVGGGGGVALENIDPNVNDHIARLKAERDTLLRTGVYLTNDAIIVELDKRIADCQSRR